MQKMKKRFCACFFIVGVTTTVTSWAQTYPSRAIRFIVPTAPGGGPDVVARMIAPKLTELLGQQVVVENRAGANAMIGAEVVARALPDGYTWLFGTGQNTVNPSVMKRVSHDIVADFAPVSLVYQSSFIMVLHPNVPAKSVNAFIVTAKAQPNKLNFGSGGIGSAAHLSGEMFMMMTGVRMEHVAYKGVGLALGDLIGGQLDLMYPAIASGLPYHRSGRLRALGVTSPKRHPSAPEVPTIAETVPKYDSRSWIGVLVPVGTPRDIVNRINAALVKVVNAPDVRQALIDQGTDPETNTPEEFGKYIRDEIVRAARIVKAAGIKPE